MSDGIVQVAPDSTGKKIDTSELTVGANSVERQRIVIGDDSAAAGLAEVQNTTPTSTDYGLTVRQVPIPDTASSTEQPNSYPYNSTGIAVDDQHRFASFSVWSNGAGRYWTAIPQISLDNGATWTNIPAECYADAADAQYSSTTHTGRMDAIVVNSSIANKVSYGFCTLPQGTNKFRINYTGTNGDSSCFIKYAASSIAHNQSSVYVQGQDAVNAIVSSNPVQVAGKSPSSTVKTLGVDANGYPIVVGPAANGSAVAGNPILNAGYDGANARTLATDGSGRQIIVGAAADGAAAQGNPLLIAGVDDSGNTQTILTDISGHALVGLPMQTQPQFPGYEKFDPTAIQYPSIDTLGSLITRSSITTDEQSFRASFPGTSLLVSLGSCSASGSIITGSFSTADIKPGEYFKFDADPTTSFAQVKDVTSTQLFLTAAYSGSASGAASKAMMAYNTTNASTFTVAANSGAVAIALPTTAGDTFIARRCDYGPLTFRARGSLASAQVNQTVCIGFQQSTDTSTEQWCARFTFGGSSANTIVCETNRNTVGTITAGDKEQTTLTQATDLFYTANLDFRINLLFDRVIFYINEKVVATHFQNMPQPSDVCLAGVFCKTFAGATANTFTLKYLTVENFNAIKVQLASDNTIVNPVPMQPIGFSQAGVIAINTNLLVIDCSQYRSLNIQCTSMGTTGVVTPAWSIDGTTWVNASIMTSAGAAAATFNAAGLWTVPVLAKYFRLRLTTATTAGTTTIFANGVDTQQGPLIVQPVSGSLTVSSATLAASSTITPIPLATQGSSTYSTLVSAATTNATSVKASAGVIGMLNLCNTTATARYFKLFNMATAPTMGTSSPVFNFAIPANSNISIDVGPFGLRMSTGIAFAITGGIALLDNTAVAANDILVNISYT